MKAYDLQPSRENIMTAFTDNIIDRNKDVVRFVELLNSIEDSCSIAIDGKWGSGKTFFVKQIKMILEMYNPFFKNATSEDYVDIKNHVGGYITNSNESESFQPQVAAYYDAWANDNDVDPILSIVYEILQSVNSDFNFEKGKTCIQIAGGIAEFFTGKKVTSLLDLARAEDPFLTLKSQKNIHALISEFLDSLLIEKGNRLVVFVDELDRCKPSYAVQLLERIKHYFQNNLITFVFSVNLDELQHTIKQHYGDQFDACRYLDRFFDLRISLPSANLTKYYQVLGLNDGNHVYECVCREVIKINRFELREITKFYRMAKVAAYKPTHNNSYGFNFSSEKALQFCLLCVVPVMLGLKVSDSDRYNAFIHGEDSSPLIEVMGSDGLGLGICSLLFKKNETYNDSPQSGEVKVSLANKLKEVYEALFVVDHSRDIHVKTIGQSEFSKGTYDKLMSVLSLLSGFSDFSI